MHINMLASSPTVLRDPWPGETGISLESLTTKNVDVRVL
jgi:hypothetical protein